MPDIVSQIADVPAVESQLRVLIGGLKEAKTLIDNINANPIGGKASNLTAQTAATDKLAQANAKLVIAQTKIQQAEEKLKITIAQREAAEAKAAGVSEQSKSKSIKAATDAALAEERLTKAKAQTAAQSEASARKEIKVTQDQENELKNLSKAYADAKIQSANFSSELGKNHYVTLQAEQDARNLAIKLDNLRFRTSANYKGGGGSGGAGGGTNGGEGEESERNGGGGSFVFARKAFGFLRMAAYVLPGLGIAGILNGVIEGLGKAMEATGLFDSSMEKLLKTQLALNKAQLEGLKTMKEMRETFASPLNKEVQMLENELKYNQAIGKSKKDILETEQKLINKKAYLSNKDFFDRGGFDKEQEIRNKFNEAKTGLDEARFWVSRTEAGDPGQDAVNPFGTMKDERESALKVAEDKYAIAKLQYDEIKDLNEKNAQNIALSKAKEIEIEQHVAEQKRKIVLDTINYETELEKSRNERILADDRSTLKQRISAIDSYSESVRRAAEAQLAYTLAQPDAYNKDGSMTAESSSAVLTASKTKIEAIHKAQDDERKVIEEYRSRELTAIGEFNDSVLEMQKQVNARRSVLLKEDYKSQMDVIEQTTALELKLEENAYRLYLNQHRALVEQAKRGDETAKAELRSAESDHYRKLAIIASDGELAILDMKEKIAQRLLDLQEKTFANRIRHEQNNGTTDELRNVNELTDGYRALNQGLKDGSIQYKDYVQAKDKLDETYKTNSIEDQITALEKQKTIMRERGDYLGTIELQIANLNKSLEEKKLKDVETYEKKKLDLRKKNLHLIAELESATAQLITNLISRQYTDRLNHIQDLMDANQKATDQEITNISTLVLSDEEKAAKTILAKEQGQIKENQLLKEQRDIKYQQALFEQQASIIQVAIKTQEAVAQSQLEGSILASNPLTAALAPMAYAQIPIEIAIGAVSAAAILAKGLPKFELGTDSAPGGLALTDEKGAELYIKKDGSMFMGSDEGANIKNIEKGTKIVPAHKKDAFLMENMIAALGISYSSKNDVSDSIHKQTKSLVKAIKDNKVTTINKIRIDLSTETYKNNLRN